MNTYTKHKVLLKAEDVNLQYGDKQILRDINFTIQDIHREGVAQGQVVSLIGRSGIGKTQLFRILAGLIKPTSGVVHIEEDQHPVQAGEMGIVPQHYVLFNHRTIYQNLKSRMKRLIYLKAIDQREKLLMDSILSNFILTGDCASNIY